MYSLLPRFLRECLLSRLIANIRLRVYMKHKRIFILNIHFIYAQNKGKQIIEKG